MLNPFTYLSLPLVCRPIPQENQFDIKLVPVPLSASHVMLYIGFKNVHIEVQLNILYFLVVVNVVKLIFLPF